MKHSAFIRTFCLPLCALFCAGMLSAKEPDPVFSGWKQASTRHFRFIFEEGTREQAQAFARVADTAWNRVSEAYSTPPDHTDAIITGRTDIVNAYAEGINFSMGFFTNPPIDPEFGFRQDWPTLFFTHELIHVANFSFEGKKNSLSDIFGPAVNLFNVGTLPGWSIEGTTTVLETELTKGGRGRSPFFELYYKAPALENSFIKYAEIGTEAEPPRGQIYVMGYLLMRSIADRYGLGAIADIERNRSTSRDFAESLQLVTGHSPEELFQDVRISLAKKYAAERSIPEGKTVTPRTVNSNYYIPALIGTKDIVTIRRTQDAEPAAVRYDPATGTETLLFEGNFPDNRSLAAAEDGSVVASLTRFRSDRMPGYTSTTDLYTWSEGKGLTQLTRGTSLFQPTLSRDGKRLVAVELAGIHYRLVEVHPVTGTRTVLLESDTESYIQPALSPDGSTVAFLELDDTRAVLATAPMPKYEFAYPVPPANVSRAVNRDGAIMDIAYPSWSRDGILQFSSNERGRLEVWEYRDGKKRPVVADPVGAFWAERTPKGIWYASYAGTGFVLKIKPDSEWGKVPATSGPSLPGEIVSLGALAEDYPGFEPFNGAMRKAAEENSTGDKKAALLGAQKKQDKQAVSIPHAEKTRPNGEESNESETVMKRPEGIRTTEISTELTGERPFINAPKLLFWLPTIDAVGTNESPYYGFGGFSAFTAYPLQAGSQTNILAAGGCWYPKLGQADAAVYFDTSLRTGTLMFLGQRALEQNSRTGAFTESNIALLSFSLPVANRSFAQNSLDLALICAIQGLADRTDPEPFSASATIPWRSGMTASTGLDLFSSLSESSDQVLTIAGSATVLVSSFSSDPGEVYLSGEFTSSCYAGTRKVQAEAGLRARWFDLPEDAPIPLTLVDLKQASVDCLYPGRAILEAALVIPGSFNTRFFSEKMVSFGTSSTDMDTPNSGNPLNLTLDPDWFVGIELEAIAGRSSIAFGVVNQFRQPDAIELIEGSRLYLSIKLDAMRVHVR